MAYANTQSGIPIKTANTAYFGQFPKIDYDINNILTSSEGPHETITDVFFRVGMVKDVINNVAAYTVYEIQDGDTPEVLAEKFYKDRGAGWIIMYANGMQDASFDFPLDYSSFIKMIIDRYGSVANAQSTIHHSELTITRTNEFGDSHSDTYVIDANRQTDTDPDVPYDYLANSGGSYQTYELNGYTIIETTESHEISCYDWELQQNDSKRSIKIIKAEYYPQIMNEFKNLTEIGKGKLPTIPMRGR